MADQRIIQLPDTPGVDTANDEMAVDNVTDGARRIPVGRAGGPAILDANGKIANRLAYEGQANGVATLDADGVVDADLPLVCDSGNWDTTTTTEVYDQAPVLAVINLAAKPYDRAVLVTASVGVKTSDTSGAWRGRIMYSTDGGNNWTATATGSVESSGGRSYATLALSPALIQLAANDALLIGIQIGNAVSAGPTVTIYSAPTYSGITAMAVRV